MKRALADLPNEHLWSLGDSIKAMPASSVLGWLGDLVLWERKRRFGEMPGELPEPSIAPEQLPVAMLLLHTLTEPFRADGKAGDLEPLIRLFETAAAHLEATLSRGGARVQ